MDTSEIKRQQTRDRVKRYRDKQSVTSPTPESVTPSVTSDSVTDPSVTYPAIVRAVTDPVKRAKLVKIYQGLSQRKLAPHVRYGIYGPSFDVVGKILEVT